MGQSTPPAMHKSAAQVAREKEIKLIRICMAITAVMMVGEIVVGYQLQVMSLVADSYHMMNDLAAFVVQLYADELANVDRTHGTETTAFSFGFARVELIANLIQGTLLVALCLTLSLESLQRFYSAEEVLLPPVVIGLGLLALAWNIANIYLFEDAHSHGQHSIRKGRRSAQSLVHPWTYRARLLQDAYGNVAIIVDGLASLLFGPKTARFSGLVKHWNGVVYVDPICSLIVVNVILKHALPLVTSSSFALMHAFDPIKADAVRSLLKRGNEAWLPTSLRERVSLTLVDLRIWRLSKTSTFATLKLRARFHDGGDATLHDVRALESAVRKAVSTKVDHCPEDQVAVDIDTGNAAVANDRVDSLPHHQNHHDKPASLRRTKSSNQLGRSSWRSSLPRAEASGALRYD
ncbi:Zinc resistance conferring protein [Rhodotorula toruloides]